MMRNKGKVIESNDIGEIASEMYITTESWNKSHDLPLFFACQLPLLKT